MNSKLDHWSNYWKAGNLTSLPQDFLENYDGEIATFWKNTFSLLSKQSKVLDLCTGNGAIAILASVYSQINKAEFRVTGVDAANIDKQSIISKYSHLESVLEKIEFISECKIENIDLPSTSFDLITSQYGIEYCDWQKSARQVFRLLKSGGRFVFISHTNSTAILSFMEQEKEEYKVLQDLGLFSALANYFKRKSRYNETVRKLNKIQKKILELHRCKPSDLFVNILGFLQRTISFDKTTFIRLEEEIRFMYDQYIFAYARLQDIVGVSNKIKNEPEWYLAFESKGLKLEGQGDILQAGRHNAGKYYQFIKPNE